MNPLTRYLEEDHDDKPWGDVIGASLLVILVTFSGVLLTSAVGCFAKLAHPGERANIWTTVHNIGIPSFAGGALLATSVFLLIPEAFELLAGEHGEEHGDEHDDERRRFFRFLEGDEEGELHEGEEAHWKFGTAFLLGFLFPIIIGAIFPPPDISACEECRKREEEEINGLTALPAEEELEPVVEESDKATMDEGCDSGDCMHHSHHSSNPEEGEVTKEAVVTKKEGDVTAQHHKDSSINWPLVTSILVGDGFHNFTDGIFIGNAFLLCSRDIAYTLVATTIYHELAQEIADFALLTHHCGLGTKKALLLNFFSGFSVMLGAVMILALDLDAQVTGVLLSVSAGVYVYIAATECIPRIQAARRNAKDTFLFLGCFALGAIPIGLVLLNHGHCEAEEDHHDDEERFL